MFFNAQTTANVANRQEIVLKSIVDSLPEGPLYFPEDIATDSTVREMSTEIIREKIYLQPYGSGAAYKHQTSMSSDP